MTIPWFYIWSPKYEIFHHILSSSVLDCSGFVVHPCFFPQSAFERIKVREGEHFFSGYALKFKMILNELKDLAEDSPFILSDADVYVRDANAFYKTCESKLVENTIIGMAEWTDNTEFTNIGILLCKNTKQVRDFFAFLAETIEATGSQDQALFNKHVSTWIPDRSLFSTTDVIQSNMRNLYGTPFSVIQFLSSSSTSNMNIYEKLITAAGFLDITPVLHLVPFEIQEALVLFYRDYAPHNPVASFRLKE